MKENSFHNNVRQCLLRSLKKNSEGRWFKHLSFNLKELKNKLENDFKTEMSWNNFGIVWGMDFIIPPKHFRLSNKVEFNKCFNLENIKPEFLKEIRKKQGRLFWEEVEKYKIFDLLPVGSLHLKGRIK